MKHILLLTAAFCGLNFYSQDFIQTSSVRVDETFGYYEEMFDKIYEYSGQSNLSIIIYQVPFENDEIESGQSLSSLIKINDQYLPLELGFKNKFEVKELVGGENPELIIYSTYCEDDCVPSTSIVNIPKGKPFVLSNIGYEMPVLNAKGKINYFSRNTQSEQTFEYNFTIGANDIIILSKMNYEEDNGCFDYIQVLNYREFHGFTKGQILKKLPTECVACFLGEMLVSVNETAQKPIADLKIGDTILSYDFQAKKNKTVSVQNLLKVKHEEFISYIFDNDTIIATPDHPFYVENKGWASSKPTVTSHLYANYPNVAQISINDELILKDGRKCILKAMIPLQELHESYTITALSEGTSFYINNILVGTEEIRHDSLSGKPKIIRK